MIDGERCRKSGWCRCNAYLITVARSIQRVWLGAAPILTPEGRSPFGLVQHAIGDDFSADGGRG